MANSEPTPSTEPDAGVTQPGPRPNHGRAGRNLPAAITVGVVLFAILVATLGWFPIGFQVLVAVALALGAVEVYQALKRLDMHAAIVPIVVGTVAIVFMAYIAGQGGLGISANTLMLALLGLIALVSLVWRMPKGEQGYVRDVAASLFIIGYIPLLGSFVGLMLADNLGRERVITYIVVVILGDIGGYVAGVLFGKHKMAPRISPKKTWEGFAGSVVFGIAGAIPLVIWLLHVPFWVGIILGAVLVVAGACGDLIESLIKRDVGIKDMSSFLPGHGGVMDRLDSLLVAAPFAWFIMVLFVPGGAG